MENNNINPEHKSPWAYIVLIVVALSFGSFWFLQSTNINTPPVAIVKPPKKNFLEDINILEATASAIELPEFSTTN
jgi:hypothetical protein